MTTKRMVAGLAAAAALAAATGAAVTASEADAHTTAARATTHRVVFHLDGRTAHRSFFGADDSNPQPGDRLTEYAKLKQHGKVVGRFMNACDFVVGGTKANDDYCSGVIEVGSSQIVLGGSGDADRVPVVGGRGKYAFISGYVADRSTKTGATFTVVYRSVG
jgi:hypothetical protein